MKKNINSSQLQGGLEIILTDKSSATEVVALAKPETPINSGEFGRDESQASFASVLKKGSKATSLI